MKNRYLFCCALLLSVFYTYYTHTMQEHNNNQADPIAQVEQCGICLENLAPANTEDPLQRLTCGHEYCYSCIAHWAAAFRHPNNPTCPQCRALFTLEPDAAIAIAQPIQRQPMAAYGNRALGERANQSNHVLRYIKRHPYIIAGSVLAATGTLAYKYRKPLTNLLAQAKARAQNLYHKLLALRLFKLQEAQTQTDVR